MTTGTTESAHDLAPLCEAVNFARHELAEMSDRDLIARITRRDRGAMHVLYARHCDNVYRLAYRILRSRQAAEDIAGEVFLELWRGAGRFERRCELPTWLFVITRNKSIDALRRGRTDPLDEQAMLLVEDEADDPETQLHKQHTNSVVRRCLDHLSPAHRAVVELVYFQEKSTQEAATIAGITRATVKTRLFYAREQLSRLLGAKGIASAAA